MPKSLEIWRQRKGMKEEGNEFERRIRCNKTITEPIVTRDVREKRVLSNVYWNNLDRKLQKDKLLSYFPKVLF